MAETDGQLDNRLGQTPVGVGELDLSISPIIPVGIHEALQQGEALLRCRTQVGLGDMLVAEHTEVAQALP